VHGAHDSSSCYMNIPKDSKLFVQIVRETSFSETFCPGKVLSGKRLIRETSCPGNVCPGKWLSGKRPLPEIHVLPLKLF